MHKVTVDGVKIAYQEYGQGVPIVFAHEFAGDMHSWESQVKYFEKTNHVVIYNAVGYPPSDVPESIELYGREQQIKNLKGLLDHLNLHNVHLVGLSMGAHMALGFALQFPDRLRSLVLAGAGTGSSDVGDYRSEMEERASMLEAHGMEGLASYTLSEVRIGFKHRNHAGWNKFAENFLKHSSVGSAKTLRGYQAKRPSIYSLEPQLVDLNLPVLLIVGDEDQPCVGPAQFMHSKFKNSNMIFFANSGHAVNIEYPEYFNECLQDFYLSIG